MPISRSPYLSYIALFTSLFPLCLGINALIQPRSALSVLEFAPPSSDADKKLVDNLLRLYGVRDVFLGLSIITVTFLGHKKATGWLLLWGSGVVTMDGVVAGDQIGRGEWNHWSFAPVMLL